MGGLRRNPQGLPGTPDVVFTGRRKAVWLHGCFWHSHDGCRFATVPKTRADYWIPQLARNRQRDAEHAAALSEMGWGSRVVWECELADIEAVRGGLAVFLGPTRMKRVTATDQMGSPSTLGDTAPPPGPPG